jgi:hypothetical protein
VGRIMGLLRFKYNPSSLLSYLAALVAAFFLATASYELWNYFQLKQKTAAVVYHWKILKKASSQYAIRASYTFEIQGKNYTDKTIFGKPYHLNRLSAENQVKRLHKQPLTVWYQSNNPDHSSLSKEFPLKKCLYALLVLGVAIYFVTLRWRYHNF